MTIPPRTAELNLRYYALWQKRIDHELRIESMFKRRNGRGPGVSGFVRDTGLGEWLFRATGLWEKGRACILHPTLREETVHFAKLPMGLDGMRLLHLSDFHFAEDDPEFVKAVLPLAATPCDLCVMTGDYRFEHYGPSDHVYRAMESVCGVLQSRHGAVAVLGNHDRSWFVEPLRDAGLTVLINEATSISHNEATLWITGVDDPHKFRSDDLDLAMEEVPEDGFTLLLAHTPELVYRAAARNIDFYLAGHTHWGQFRLPMIGAPYLNIRCPRRFGEGFWRHGPTQGYTTAGLGATDYLIRLACSGEAVLFTLRRGGS